MGSLECPLDTSPVSFPDFKFKIDVGPCTVFPSHVSRAWRPLRTIKVNHHTKSNNGKEGAGKGSDSKADSGSGSGKPESSSGTGAGK